MTVLGVTMHEQFNWQNDSVSTFFLNKPIIIILRLNMRNWLDSILYYCSSCLVIKCYAENTVLGFNYMNYHIPTLLEESLGNTHTRTNESSPTDSSCKKHTN